MAQSKKFLDAASIVGEALATELEEGEAGVEVTRAGGLDPAALIRRSESVVGDYGPGGKTPGIAALAHATTVGALPQRSAPAPVRTNLSPKLTTRTHSNKPGKRFFDREPTEAEYRDLHRRGLATRGGPAKSGGKAMRTIKRSMVVEPNDRILQPFSLNGGKSWYYGETIKSLAHRAANGVRLAQAQARAGVERSASAQPAVVLRQYATDQFGRPRLGQTIRNVARRSVGLPR